MNKISEKSLQIISQMQQNEIDEYHIYKKIAKNLKKDKENAATLNRIADEEFKHYLTWRSYTHKTKKPRLLKVLWYTIIAKILGFTEMRRKAAVFRRADIRRYALKTITVIL